MEEVNGKMYEHFMAVLNRSDKKANGALLTYEKYLMLMQDVKSAKGSSKKKAPRDYWLLQHYDVLDIQGTEKLIVPIKGNDTQVIFYVHKEELFETLLDTHQTLGHGGRDRMVKQLQKKYKNITQHQIQCFLNVCEACQQKRKTPKKIVVKPIHSEQLNSRCQIDLIDFHSHPDGIYKFIMVYQDHLTKFTLLRPLETKSAQEVAERVLEIFLMFGAPCILHSDNGREFCNGIIESIKTMWPELKLLCGKPMHSPSPNQGSGDVENMLTTWMQQNETNNWSKGLHFVQFMKNRAFHSGIRRSPYNAMFGVDPKVGLTSSSLPKELMASLHDEDDLQKLLQSIVKDEDSLPLDLDEECCVEINPNDIVVE